MSFPVNQHNHAKKVIKERERLRTMLFCQQYNLLAGDTVRKFTEKGDIDATVLVGVISSSVTFALTTVVCFIVGFISSRVSTNLTKCVTLSRGRSNTTDYSMATNPVYDDIMPREVRPREKDPELEENVAYKF